MAVSVWGGYSAGEPGLANLHWVPPEQFTRVTLNTHCEEEKPEVHTGPVGHSRAGAGTWAHPVQHSCESLSHTELVNQRKRCSQRCSGSPLGRESSGFI